VTSTQKSNSLDSTEQTASQAYRWRVVDIVVASVIGVASGVIFLVWNVASEPVTGPLKALLPGLQALGGGFWLFAGPLTALIIRKPGAAMFGELVAASVSVLFGGGSWGVTVLVSGLIQGLGAEVVFLAFRYRVWKVGVAILAGVGAGVAMAINDLIAWYAGADALFTVVYVIAAMISGAVIAGLLSWIAVRGLAETGVLNRFAAGRERAGRV
jgi:energy-coupling factor transport system substrate-specific component